MCKEMQQEQGPFIPLQVSYVSVLFIFFPKEICIAAFDQKSLCNCHQW